MYWIIEYCISETKITQYVNYTWIKNNKINEKSIVFLCTINKNFKNEIKKQFHLQRYQKKENS